MYKFHNIPSHTYTTKKNQTNQTKISRTLNWHRGYYSPDMSQGKEENSALAEQAQIHISEYDWKEASQSLFNTSSGNEVIVGNCVTALPVIALLRKRDC